MVSNTLQGWADDLYKRSAVLLLQVNPPLASRSCLEAC